MEIKIPKLEFKQSLTDLSQTDRVKSKYVKFLPIRSATERRPGLAKNRVLSSAIAELLQRTRKQLIYRRSKILSMEFNKQSLPLEHALIHFKFFRATDINFEQVYQNKEKLVSRLDRKIKEIKRISSFLEIRDVTISIATKKEFFKFIKLMVPFSGVITDDIIALTYRKLVDIQSGVVEDWGRANFALEIYLGLFGIVLPAKNTISDHLHLEALAGHLIEARNACEEGSSDYSIEIGRMDENGLFPLHMAIIGGHYKMSKLLLSKGALPFHKSLPFAMTPFELAANLGQWEISELFLLNRMQNIHKKFGGKAFLKNLYERTEYFETEITLEHGAWEFDSLEDNYPYTNMQLSRIGRLLEITLQTSSHQKTGSTPSQTDSKVIRLEKNSEGDFILHFKDQGKEHLTRLTNLRIDQMINQSVSKLRTSKKYGQSKLFWMFFESIQNIKEPKLKTKTGWFGFSKHRDVMGQKRVLLNVSGFEELPKYPPKIIDFKTTSEYLLHTRENRKAVFPFSLFEGLLASGFQESSTIEDSLVSFFRTLKFDSESQQKKGLSKLREDIGVPTFKGVKYNPRLASQKHNLKTKNLSHTLYIPECRLPCETMLYIFWLLVIFDIRNLPLFEMMCILLDSKKIIPGYIHMKATGVPSSTFQMIRVDELPPEIDLTPALQENSKYSNSKMKNYLPSLSLVNEVDEDNYSSFTCKRNSVSCDPNEIEASMGSINENIPISDILSNYNHLFVLTKSDVANNNKSIMEGRLSSTGSSSMQTGSQRNCLIGSLLHPEAHQLDIEGVCSEHRRHNLFNSSDVSLEDMELKRIGTDQSYFSKKEEN